MHLHHLIGSIKKEHLFHQSKLTLPPPPPSSPSLPLLNHLSFPLTLSQIFFNHTIRISPICYNYYVPAHQVMEASLTDVFPCVNSSLLIPLSFTFVALFNLSSIFLIFFFSHPLREIMSKSYNYISHSTNISISHFPS